MLFFAQNSLRAHLVRTLGACSTSSLCYRSRRSHEPGAWSYAIGCNALLACSDVVVDVRIQRGDSMAPSGCA